MLEIGWLRDQLAKRADAMEPRDEIQPRWDRAMGLNIGRRGLFKLALSSSTLVPLAAHATRPKALHIESSGKTFSLRSPNGRIWTIDPDRFEGSPSLQVERNDSTFAVS